MVLLFDDVRVVVDLLPALFSLFFFFIDPAPTEIYPLPLHAALPISEFLPPYTPYQPEISQGGLQVMFEFQTAISELTGLPVSNASLYEGPSSVASAGYLALLEHKGDRRRFVTTRGLHPHSRETLETYSSGFGTEVVETPLDARGATD